MSAGCHIPNRHTNLSIINANRQTLPGPNRLQDLVLDADPDHVAIDFVSGEPASQQTSYRDLRVYVQRLTAVLLRRCRPPFGLHNIIPVIIPQCPELYISYLAILEAGAGFCPISPDTPPDRLKFIIHDVDAQVVLTLPSLVGRLGNLIPDTTLVSVSLHDLRQRDIALSPNGNGSIPRHVNSIGTAYVMYTSGSTGLPKGVRISHAAVTQSLLAHDEHIPKFKRFLQFASPTFDVSIFEIFFTFLRGVTLVCCEREMLLADLPGIINRLNIDAAELTPTVAGTLLRSRRHAPSLKLLLTIGEMLTRHVVEEFGGSETQESILYAMYGPTEAAIHCTIASHISATSSVQIIGRPLTTVTAFVLAQSRNSSYPQILPVGQEGELAIAGQLADGYLNRAEQTREAFVIIPKYGPVYRTGDRAVFLESGELHILGRISSGQVKLRGQRVELGEVEEVACKLSNVDLAVASVINEALVLFCAGNDRLSTNEVSTACSSWLPAFMQPTDIVLVPEIPRLPSGKIDRNTLVQKYQEDMHSSDSDVAVEDAKERSLAELIGNQLSVRVGSQSSLAHSGLDSLRAIKIATLLRKEYPTATVSMLLESRTIQDLVRRLNESELNHSTVQSSALYEHSDDWRDVKATILSTMGADTHEGLIDDLLPCAPMQIAMLVESLADEEANFNSIQVRLGVGVCLNAFKQAMVQVAETNSILRSGFLQGLSHTTPFVQVVWRDLRFDKPLDLLHPLQIDRGDEDDNIIIRIHHALYDGWSWDLIMEDVNACLRQQQIPVRPSYQVFRRALEQVDQAKKDADKAYWDDFMAGYSPSSFPDLRGHRSDAKSRQSIRKILSTTSSALSEKARSLAISQEIFVQAALSLLMGSYCDTSDVVFGTVSSGRETAINGIDQIIGPCLAIYPVRVSLLSVRSVHDLLLYIHRLHLARLQHNTTTLGQIYKQSMVPLSSRLIDVLSVWQEGLTKPSHMTMVQTINDTDELRYTLVVETVPIDGQLAMKITFNSSKIPPKQAEILLDQLDNLIAVLIADCHLHLKSIWNRSHPENLSISNPDFETFDNSFHLASTIMNIARDDPERIAIQFVRDLNTSGGNFKSEQLNYGQLFMKASVAAQNLIQHHGVRPNDLVCIFLKKSVELYIMILATVLAGAGYMCIDPKTPDSRISQILAEAECRLIITSMTERFSKISHCCQQSIATQDLLECCKAASVDLPVPSCGEDLAYTIFTSGSTGKPKGVLLTRKNLLSNLDQLSKIYPKPANGDKLLQACSQAFDVSVFEIFWTWHSGMTLCTSSNDVLFRDLEVYINALRITHLSMTASVAALVDAVKVPSVKFLVTAGESMNSKVFSSWSNNGLHQGYGPSETTNICNVKPFVRPGDHVNNVGPAFSNTSLFICRQQEKGKEAIEDRTLSISDFHLLPKGAVGEVWIGGDQVARGYIDPDLTAQSFCEHPHYGRLYRSGDVGRLLEDGSLIVLGRTDDQVKLRGQRIELGDINSTFVKHKAVKDFVSLVLGVADKARLIGFYVCTEAGSQQSAAQRNASLFSWATEQLPSYMIPDFLVALERLPLTSQGKVDRRCLTKLFSDLSSEETIKASRGSSGVSDDTPMNSVEQRIAEILAQAVHIPYQNIARGSSFIGLGLDSISSIGFAQRLRHAGFPHANVSTVLKYSTVRRLADYLCFQSNGIQHNSRQVSLEDYFDDDWLLNLKSTYSKRGLQVEYVMPCTPLQEVMLASSRGTHGRTYFNSMTFDIRISNKLFKNAWQELVHRHALLRTAFVETNSSDFPYAQVVLKSFPAPWLDHKSGNRDTEEHKSTHLPPYQLSWTADGHRKVKLNVDMHHALYDAEAMSILLGDAERLLQGQEVAPPVPFSTYIEYMLRLSSKEVNAYWSNIMRGCKSTRIVDMLSLNKRNASASTSCTASVVLDDLNQTAKSIRVTPLAVIQATLARLLSFLTETKDVSFGNVFSGRNIPIDSAESIVGPCFNTLPIRATLADQTTNRDLCVKLHLLNTEILPLQPSSLRKIQREHSQDGRPLFDVLLLLQNQTIELNPEIWSLEHEEGDMDFPLIFEIVSKATSNDLEIVLHYQIDDQKIARRLIQNFEVLLQQTTRYPENLAVDFYDIPLWRPVESSSKNLRDQQTKPVSNGHLAEAKDVWSSTELMVRDVLDTLTQITKPVMTPATTIFRLGLDSINAVQIASKLREKGFKINSNEIILEPSIRSIATTCQKSVSAKVTNQQYSFDINSFDQKYRPYVLEHPLLEGGMVEAVLPCTSAQNGMLSQFLKSQGSLYYNSMTFSLDPTIDPQRLQSAWTTLMLKHDILRTGFAQIESARYPFAMVVYAAGVWSLPWTEGEAGLTGCDRRAERLEQPCWKLSYYDQDGNSKLRLSMLHALYDAHSLTLMFDDLSAIYRGLNLPPTISWRKVLPKIVYTGAEDEAKQFWTSNSDVMQNTQFPNLNVFHDRDQTYRVTSCPLTISLSELKRKCASLDTSTQTLCQVAWAQLLAAYTGQSCVTFGTILSGRTFDQEEQNKIVFPCLSTLPFAIDTKVSSSKLLKIASRYNANLIQHQRVPLTIIKKWCGVSEDLFDTVFVYQALDDTWSDTELFCLDCDDARAEYAVSIEILPQSDDSVRAQLTYRLDTVPESQANLILKQYNALLVNLMDRQSDDLQRKPCGDDSLYSALVSKEPTIPTDIRLLHEFVERTARRYSHRIALEFVTGVSATQIHKKCWTYAELDLEGNRIANMLTRHKSKVGDLIAVCFDKCSHASFAILGTLKAGCTFVAIDPRAPPARKAFILDDARCRIVLTTNDKLGLFESNDCIVVAVDDENIFQQDDGQHHQTGSALTTTDSCYCLYTSGTTGTPKGCLISHSSAVQAMMSFQRIFQGRWTEHSRWLQFASFHFDVSVLEQYWSWSVGICVTSVPLDTLFEDLPGTMSRLAITHLDLTPSLARLLTPEAVPSLCDGVFIVGGEQVRQDVLDTWGDVGCLYNFYGPSEVTIGCTVRPQVTKNTRPSNIGQQWDNVGSFVLEPDSQTPVLRGAIGELCLSGPLVGKGYLNRPDLTEQKFGTLANNGTRIYRTGDLVRLLHDDSFDFLGRMDDQVKLRGQRLEVGEINHVVLNSKVNIKNAASLVLKHPRQEKEQLVMFFSTVEDKRNKQEKCEVVRDQAASDVAEQLRQICISRLPPYMVPTHFVMLNFIPLNVNNKMDAKALKILYESKAQDHDQKSSSTACPNGTTEPGEEDRKLCKILESFFDLPEFSATSSSRLLEIGLDSISVISLSRVLKRNGFPGADITTIMSAFTVTELSNAILQQSQSRSSDEEVQRAKDEIALFAKQHLDGIKDILSVPVNNIESCALCTSLQQGMISTVAKNDLNDSTYFTAFTYRLDPDINIDRLREAWKQTVVQADILRTYFVATADGHAQVVVRSEKLDNSSLEVKDRIGSIRELFRDWVRSARNFEDCRPWRLCFARDNGVLHMGLLMFHGVYDGISLPALLRLVMSNYSGRASNSNKPPCFYEVLPHGPLRRVKGAKDFWIRHLQHVQPLGLDEASPAMSDSPSTITSAVQLSNLSQLAKTLHTTTPAIFQAAWIHVLRTRYGIDPTIGIVVSGRSLDIEAGEQVIGPLFNTMPFSSGIVSTVSKLTDLIKVCHQFNIESLPYQHTSIRDIGKWLGAKTHRGLFDSLFVFQKSIEAANDEDVPPLWEEINSSSEPDYPLNTEVTQIDGSHYNITMVAVQSQRLSKTDVDDLFQSFVDTLERLNRSDDVELGQIDPAKTMYQASQTPTEDISKTSESLENENLPIPFVTQIRSEVAKLAEIDVASLGDQSPTLFEIGLDSVDILKLTSRLKKAQLHVSVNDIMQNPTVMGIAIVATKRKLQTQTNSSTQGTIASKQEQWRSLLREQGVARADVQVVLPVTSMQEGLLLNYEQYYHVLPYEIKSTTDSRRLARAIEKTIARSPVLRSVFAPVEDIRAHDNFLQLVRSFEDFQFQVRFVNSDDVAGTLHELEKYGETREISEHSIQALIVTSTQGSRVLLLGMPHALYDGWSLQILHNRIVKAYNDCPETDDTVEKLLVHLNEIRTDALSTAVTSFWSTMLATAHPTLFDLRPTTKPHGRSHISQRSSAAQLECMTQLCRRTGITLQSLGLACWSVILASHTRSLNVTYGIVLSGRTTETSDDLMSPTFNTVCFSNSLPTGSSRFQFLKQTHNSMTQVMRYQHFPLKEAVKLAGRSQSQLFNTLFTFQKVLTDSSMPDELYEEYETGVENISPPFAINLEMTERNGTIWWTIAVQNDVANLDEVEGIFCELDDILSSFVRHGDESLLEEQAGETSICGMQPVKIRDQELRQANGDKSSSTMYKTDWTEHELSIREVLAEASGVNSSSINRSTGIFNLGLDSISAIKVVGMLKKRGIRLPVSKLVEARNIEEMASAASVQIDRDDMPKTNEMLRTQSQLSSTFGLGRLSISEADVESIHPTTAGQVYMLDMWRASQGRLFYANFWFEVDGASEGDLMNAFMMLRSCLPTLRSTFIEKDNRIYQVILKSSIDSERHRSPWSYWAIRSHGKLFVRLTIHHALYDAVSLHMIVSALQKFCHHNGEIPSFHTNSQPFLELVSSDKNIRCREFWVSYLKPLQPPRNDNKMLNVCFESGRTELFVPSVMTTKQLIPQLRRQGISIQSLLFAAYARVYSRKVGRSSQDSDPTHASHEVVIGIYLANRSLDVENLSNLAHPTFNIVPLKISVSNIHPLIDTAKQIQEDLRTIARPETCNVSLRQIHEWTGMTIDTFVNFLKLPDEEDNKVKDTVFEDHAINFQHAKGDALKEAQKAFAESDSIPDSHSPSDGRRDPPSPYLVDNQESANAPQVKIQEWCRPSIDIEATVSANGDLAIGLFAPSDMIDDEEARRIIEEIATVMKDGLGEV